MTTDLTRSTAAELADLLAQGSVSARRGGPGPPRPHRRRRRRRALLPARRRRGRPRPGRRRRPRAAPPASRCTPLAGVPIAVKDVMATQGLPTTCGSRILEGWVPPYDATVVARLREAGLPILGKTNMDEFAMGSSTEHSRLRPDATTRGTSTGSPAAPAAARRPRSRRSRRRSRSAPTPAARSASPRAVTGTVGVKPTYGGVSRYGLVALASSLDQAGPCTRTVLDAALLHEVIGGHDPMDSTSIDAPVPPVVEAARARRRARACASASSRELGGEGYQAGVQSPLRRGRAAPASTPAPRSSRSRCPSFDYALAAYYLILPSEASSNLAKFDAMRYGLRVAARRASTPRAPSR